MAQPMMDEILSKYIPEPTLLYTMSFIAQCGEGKLQDLMTKIPAGVELSSLPLMNGGNPNVEFALSSKDQELLQTEFSHFTDLLDTQKIGYTLL